MQAYNKQHQEKERPFFFSVSFLTLPNFSSVTYFFFDFFEFWFKVHVNLGGEKGKHK